MRIRYVGQDRRTRITEIHRIKFFSDGFRQTDTRDEMMDDLHGPVIVLHTVRAKGGAKRLTLQVPDGFDMEAAKHQLLEHGWLDLSACAVKRENLY